MDTLRPCPHAKGNAGLMMCTVVLNFTSNMLSATPERCTGGEHKDCPLYVQNVELSVEAKKGADCGQEPD